MTAEDPRLRALFEAAVAGDVRSLISTRRSDMTPVAAAVRNHAPHVETGVYSAVEYLLDDAEAVAADAVATGAPLAHWDARVLHHLSCHLRRAIAEPLDGPGVGIHAGANPHTFLHDGMTLWGALTVSFGFYNEHPVTPLRGLVVRRLPPHVAFLLNMRAMCLAGRARGMHWLCTAAPLWTLVRVVELLQWS